MDLKWLAEQVEAGRADNEIAAECGLPVHQVAYYRRTALGIVKNPEGRRKWIVDRDSLAEQVMAGMSDREIAVLREMTPSAVRQYRQRLGVQRPNTRTNHWAGRVGPEAANWRGGRTRSGSGYVRIFKPDHPGANCNGYVYEHRYVMEQKLGRLLEKGELVDHIDRNRSNNHPDNLRLQPSRSAHVKDHFSARDQLTEALKVIARYEALYGPLPEDA